MTFKERRRRADALKIADDFERIESSFLSFAQKLNKKRQAQMSKRLERVIPELIKAKEAGDKEEIEGILKSLTLPSSKEWGKGIFKLVQTATESGILRAHLELLRLRELFQFNEDWTNEVIDEGYNYEVSLPEEARDFIKKHAYEVGVITEETVINRIRKALEKGLDEGMTPKEMAEHVNEVAGAWMSPAHAETIARTETGKFYNAGRLARWLDPEQNGFVEALQYDAILDTRTTEVCRHLDGKTISVQNSAVIAEFTPPNHYRCRSTWLPITKYEEWEDDFSTEVPPEEGFEFASPLPKLLQGKKKDEPLVKPVPKVDPLTETDPDIIRSMPDDEFRLAIGNITDIALKLSMIMERAEQMVVRECGLKEVRVPPKFMWYGFDSEAMMGSFEMYDHLVEFHMTQEIREDIEDLVRKLHGAPESEIDDILKWYIDKHAGSLAHMDVIRAIRDAQKIAPTQVTWSDGLPKVEKRSKQAEKLFKIKEPPLTANYKNATALRQAVKDGQAWIDKYLHNKLAPATGVQLKFKHDLRRAYATGSQGTIHFGKYEGNFGVIVHETAHVIHWQNKEVGELVEEWFMKRTEKLQKPMTKRYGEDVIPDEFFNSYIGRIYGWEKRNQNHPALVLKNMYGQEVLSMGMQAMAENHMRFYDQDKDHFLFIYAILRGLF
ncbi:minor capsid protein [Bacillus sporothermodurans]|nr:minor capsid protein [Heyndrickxia sporothermodurans]MBL5798532.1 minor capsid protein [Heyndrickxia sporothermodurans]MBL5809450.1 minor capsid protein [Heyndrickxia sporothermodurans]MBL5813084.1 minor capsid protein [Heyndrickxia sporothermodurans]MBL5816508.1 minor capsid protein [Heyndrickxia sporothermodurans]